MRHTWLLRAAAPLVAGAMLTACSRHVGDDSGQNGSDRRKDAGGRTEQVIALKGCVEGAPDPGEYVLRNVQLEPMPAQPTDAASSVGLTVTPGSSVRLHMTDADELKKNLGQIVSVTGLITDNGASTIGTGGRPVAPDEAGSPTDASRAATNDHYSNKQAKEAGPLGQESMANGTVPMMAVQKVTGTGEQCRLDLRPEVRSQSGNKSGTDKDGGNKSR